MGFWKRFFGGVDKSQARDTVDNPTTSSSRPVQTAGATSVGQLAPSPDSPGALTSRTSAAPRDAISYEEKLLFETRGWGLQALGVAVSPDQSRVAYVIDRSSCFQVVTDGEYSDRYSTVIKGSLVFSPDSTRFVYAAVTDADKGERPVVVVDGRVISGFGRMASDPVFSPDSRHYAFVAGKHAGALTLVVDGRVGPPCEGTGQDNPRFGPTSDRVAYVTMSSLGAAVAVADVQRPSSVVEGPRFDGIASGTPIFSPDGRRIAYVAGKGGKFHVVVDDQCAPPYDGLADGSLSFSPDSAHYAYVARTAARSVLIYDGNALAQYDDLQHFRFGQTGQRHSFLARTSGGWRWVVDGSEKLELRTGDEGPIDVAVPSDLSRIAYTFRQGDQAVLMIDRSEALRTGAFSPSGNIVLLTFSPDASRWACVLRERGASRRVIVDGRPGPEFDGIIRPGIFFTPDSSHLVYFARKGLSEESLVVDHEVVATFSRVCGEASPYFAEKTALRLAVIKHDESRKDATIAQICIRYTTGAKGINAG